MTLLLALSCKNEPKSDSDVEEVVATKLKEKIDALRNLPDSTTIRIMLL